MAFNPVNKLDTVLKSFNNQSLIDKDEMNLYKSLEQILIDLLIVDNSATINDVVMILHKLVKDGYVNRVIKEDDFPSSKAKIYYLTYDGKLFIHVGGYSALYRYKRKKSEIQNRKDLMIIIGSWLAGIGAVLLTAWEIYKYYCLHID